MGVDARIIPVDQATRARIANERARDREWMDRGACRHRLHPEAWFPPKGATMAIAKVAQDICRTECPVMAECLRYALERGERDGIWGGETVRSRRAMRRSMGRVA